MSETIGQAYIRQQEERRRGLQMEANIRQDVDAERAARVYAVSAKTDLPTALVDADLDNLEAQLRRKEFKRDNYTDKVNGAPVFNKFAAENPYNFAVLERDRKNLTRFERALDPIFMGWDAGWATTELAEIVDRRLGGDIREGDDKTMEELRKLLEGGDFGAQGMFQKALTYTAQQAPIQGWIMGEAMDEAAISMTAGAMLGAVTGTPGGPAGNVIGAGAGAMLGAGAGMVSGRFLAAHKLERALAYDQYTQLGMNEREARIAAEGVGIVNGALESIGLGFLTKRLPVMRELQSNATDAIIGKIFKTPRFRDGLARFAIQYGEGMAAEVVTEVLQESTTMAAQEYLKSRARSGGDMRPEMEPMSADEFYDSLKEIAVATMYGTSILGGLGPMTQLRADARRARGAREQQAAWRSLNEAAEESKTRKEVKTAWDKFVSMQREKGSIEDIGIEVENFKKYWQGKNIDPAEAARELGIDLEEAEATGTDVRIPFEVFVDKVVATEHFNALAPDLRIRPEDMTQRESEQWYADQDKHVTEIEQALKANFDQTVDERIVDDLKGQMVGMYNEKAVDSMARLHAAVMSTTAAELGVDAYELHKQRLKAVRPEIPTPLGGQDIDMDLDPILDMIKGGKMPEPRDFLGPSIIDFIRKSGGIKEEGGELASRDLGKVFPGIVRKEGRTSDALSEIAFEQGYIPANDQSLLMDAIDREIQGTQVFSRTYPVKEEMQELRARMEEAIDFLEKEGIDYENMTNPEIRAAMKGIQTFEQSDLEAYTKLLFHVLEKDPMLLGEVWRKMPRVAEEQDFSSIAFTDRFVDENGKTGTVTQSAQDAFDNAVAERNVLKQLLDCVNG